MEKRRLISQDHKQQKHCGKSDYIIHHHSGGKDKRSKHDMEDKKIDKRVIQETGKIDKQEEQPVIDADLNVKNAPISRRERFWCLILQ